jgi:hypothetical protein
VKAALAEAMKLNPKFSVAWFHAHSASFINSHSPPDIADRARFLRWRALQKVRQRGVGAMRGDDSANLIALAR